VPEDPRFSKQNMPVCWKLAREASHRGWIVFKQVGDIIEVVFPALINEQELVWLRHTGGPVE